EWEVDSHGNYEAHFKKKGEKYRADFSEDGYWIETENDIKIKELPEPIREKIDELYFMYTISEVERVDHFEKGLFYDVEFKQKVKNKDIEFNSEGNQIN
ncbi:MAG: PepSY-like domain-containing protein, partial [Marinirhabdus sp.]|nr:PepSY-like domain-containing protein [Marinirhabdus sp.]